MSHNPRSLSAGASRRYVARLVDSKDAPRCETELDLLERGFCVTRLRTRDLYVGAGLDDKTVRMLGQLYDAIIVPESLVPRARDIEVAAGVPVVRERDVAMTS
jgi:hypothetical protein